MKTIGYGIRKTIYALVFLLMAVQIGTGILWMCGNLGGYQPFAESREMVEISVSWVLDEYTGPGYPACVWLARAAGRATGLPYYVFLYIGQLAAAFGAGAYFLDRAGLTDGLKKSRGRWRIYYGAAYLLTVPMLMQMHLAVLPFSFACSLFLALLADCVGMLRRREVPSGRALVRMCALWFGSAVFLPDYAWLAAVPVAVAFAGVMWKRRSVFLSLLLAFAVTAAGIGLAEAAVQRPGSRGRIQKSLGAAMLSRFVWPNFERNSYFWNIYITDVCDENRLLEISQEPENVIYGFGPDMERAYGRKMADGIYWQMAKVSLGVRTKETLLEVAADAAAYVCPQAAAQRQLSGRGVSYAGWNYSRMRERTPLLAKYYVRAALGAWNVALALSLLLLAKRAAGGRRGVRRKAGGGMAALLCAVLAFTAWYTMARGGMQDYRNVLPVWAVWALPVIKGWETEGAEYEENTEK